MPSSGLIDGGLVVRSTPWRKATLRRAGPFSDGAGALSGNRSNQVQDRRITRTREALIGAFNHLVLARRQRRIRVADIVAEANIGRSTFYEHFSSADDILLQSLARPMAPLADAAAGKGDLRAVTFLLAHFWENRQRARDMMAGHMDARMMRLLAGMVEERLEGRMLAIPVKLAALQLAQAALAPVRGWVLAEAPCSPAALAAAICRCGEAIVAGLAVSDPA
jgi:AcrR family transcriptional regulator